MPKLNLVLVVAAIGLAFAVGAQGQGVISPHNVLIEYMPHPRDMVQIVDGQPFTVPSGKILVLTAIGDANTASSIQLKVDGVFRFKLANAGYSETPLTMFPIPQGMTVQSGGLVEVVGGSGGVGNTWAWGYLGDE